MIQKTRQLMAIMTFICCTLPALAQQDSTAAHRFIIKFSPQQLHLGGYHFSIEKPLPHKANQAIVVAPHFYNGYTRFTDNWSERYRVGDDRGHVTGYGAEVQHRHYFPAKATADSAVPYVGYGVSFSSFNIAFETQDWRQELGSDGLQYYRYRMGTFTEKINRVGAAALVGIQGPFLSENVIMDMHVGLGYKHSSSKTNYSEPRYNKSFLDYGYKGFQPLLGASFGYAF